MKHVKPTLLIITAYFLLTVLMTWPTALHLTGGIPGDGFDGWQNYWNLWWVKQALLVEATQPFFTHLLDAPAGVSLLFHTLNIFNGLWTLPIQLNFGLAVAYNSVVFASFTLAGYGGYLLALHTLGHTFPGRPGLRPAAFVAGLIFTMSPFHIAHLLGHMQVFSMVWPPFYIVWLLRTLRPWAPPGSPTPPQQGRNAAITSLFLILATLVDWYHTLYLLMFTGVVLAWILWRNRRFWRTSAFVRPLLATAAIGAGFALILSPLLIPMVRDASSRPDLETGLVQNITLSADLLAFVLPSEMHPLWGGWAAGIANNFTSTTSERLVFAGFVPLALGVFIIVRGWTNLSVKFWTLILVIFLLMALGPYLHINGQTVAIGGWQLPMPYLLLYYTVPFINLTRSLSRYDLMIMLALGVLAALALAQLSAGQTKRQVWLPAAAAALICFEFLPAPYPISTIDTPQFYVDIAADEADYTIAELPMNWDRPTPLLHHTTHGKRLLTSYTSRANPLELAGRTPVFQQWQNLGADIIDQPLARIAPTIYYDFNLRYIILDYWQMPPGPERDSVEQWLIAALPEATPVYDDGRLKVYRTPPKTDTQAYLTLGNGWSNRRLNDNGDVFRAMSGDQPAELYLHHPQGRPFTLQITATAPQAAEVTVYAGQIVAGQAQINPQPTTLEVELPALADDWLKITLDSTGPVAVSRVTLK